MARRGRVLPTLAGVVLLTLGVAGCSSDDPAPEPVDGPTAVVTAEDSADDAVEAVDAGETDTDADGDADADAVDAAAEPSPSPSPSPEPVPPTLAALTGGTLFIGPGGYTVTGVACPGDEVELQLTEQQGDSRVVAALLAAPATPLTDLLVVGLELRTQEGDEVLDGGPVSLEVTGDGSVSVTGVVELGEVTASLVLDADSDCRG